MERVSVHVVQHVGLPTFSLAVLLRNKPNDEWMQPVLSTVYSQSSRTLFRYLLLCQAE